MVTLVVTKIHKKLTNSCKTLHFIYHFNLKKADTLLAKLIFGGEDIV